MSFDFEIVDRTIASATASGLAMTSSFLNLNTDHPRAFKAIVFLLSMNFHFFVLWLRPSTSTAIFLEGYAQDRPCSSSGATATTP